MRLAEDLCLLLTRKAATEVAWYAGTQHALAAAVVIERALDGDQDVTPDTAAAEMTAVVPGLYARVLDSLTEQGALRKSGGWWLRLAISRSMWRLRDHERRAALSGVVAAVLLGEKEPDTWTGPLVTLLCEIDVVGSVFRGMPDEDVYRAYEIAEAGWAPDERVRAVTLACRAELAWVLREP